MGFVFRVEAALFFLAPRRRPFLFMESGTWPCPASRHWHVVQLPGPGRGAPTVLGAPPNMCHLLLFLGGLIVGEGLVCSYCLLSIAYCLFAVLARALPAVVLAVARAAVLALALLAPVLAVVRAAVLAQALLAPVLALPWGLFRNPALTTAKTVVLHAAASTAASVCVLVSLPAIYAYCHRAC